MESKFMCFAELDNIIFWLLQVSPNAQMVSSVEVVGNSSQYLLIIQHAMTKLLHSQIYEAVLLWATSTKRQGNMQVSAVGFHGDNAAITHGEDIDVVLVQVWKISCQPYGLLYSLFVPKSVP